MDKLGKILQRDLVNASPSRFLMDDVKENEMASSLPQNVTADYVRAIGSDGKSYRIPKADFASIIRSELGTILNGLSDQQTVTKVPTLNGNTLGASAIATLASVLGVDSWHKLTRTDTTPVPTGINVGFGGIFAFNPTKISADLIIAVNHNGVTKLNTTWYDPSGTLVVFTVDSDGYVYVQWSAAWTEVWIKDLVHPGNL